MRNIVQHCYMYQQRVYWLHGSQPAQHRLLQASYPFISFLLGSLMSSPELALLDQYARELGVPLSLAQLIESHRSLAAMRSRAELLADLANAAAFNTSELAYRNIRWEDLGQMYLASVPGVYQRAAAS